MMTHPTLEQTYRTFLTQFDKMPSLDEFYREEELYAARVHNVLDGSGEVPVTSYGDVRAFSGGEAAAATLIREIADTTRATANELGAEVPPVFCGFWPDPRPNSRTVRLSGGGCIILLNTGTWQSIRFFTQWTALSLTDATGLPLARDADFAVPDMKVLVRKQLRDPAPWTGMSEVIADQREHFRREMNYGAMCWVISHEVGHAARKRPFQGAWNDDNPLFNQGALVKDASDLEAPHETKLTDSFGAEFIADLIATRILRSAPFTYRDRPSIPFAMGCLAAQMVMADSWWQQAAYTDVKLGWTHPAPDIRIQSVINGFTTPIDQLETDSIEDLKALMALPERYTLVGLRVVLGRYKSWCEELLDIESARGVVWKRGLADRGINPMSLVFLYMAYGKTITQASSDLL
jgi:hypothetical protein